MWPDKAKPLFHIHAESNRKETASALLGQYEEKILSWRDSTDQ
jgi:hypothetical protein